jgi:nitrilase
MRQKVAVIQIGPVGFDLDATLLKIESRVSEAASLGVQLAVFPEALLPAYPKGADFGARVGTRSPQGRLQYRVYSDHCVEIPSAAIDSLASIAGKHAMYLVVGIVERDGGTLYCTAVFISADGRIIGKHRKVMPTAVERLIWGFGDGSTLHVVDTPLGKLGAAICWENYMPLLRTAMYSEGVELYCAPTVDDRDSWIPTMQHIAVEGRCFVLAACQYVDRLQYPPEFGSAPADTPVPLIRGGSLIVDPFGQILGGPVYGRECVIVAEIDTGQIAEGKYDLDVVGHYSRPDLFQLRVNRASQQPVSESGDA